jgi:hypothetical protein
MMLGLVAAAKQRRARMMDEGGSICEVDIFDSCYLIS